MIWHMIVKKQNKWFIFVTRLIVRKFNLNFFIFGLKFRSIKFDLKVRLGSNKFSSKLKLFTIGLVAFIK